MWNCLGPISSITVSTAIAHPPGSTTNEPPGPRLTTIPSPVLLPFHRSLQAGFQQDSSRMPPGCAWLAPAIGDRRIAAPAHAGRSLRVEVIAMRRLGVIVALGALLGMFGGVVTASLAGQATIKGDART